MNHLHKIKKVGNILKLLMRPALPNTQIRERQWEKKIKTCHLMKLDTMKRLYNTNGCHLFLACIDVS